MKPTQREDNSSGSCFFSLCRFSNFLCVEKERGRGGKEREGSMEGLKQDSAVK